MCVVEIEDEEREVISRSWDMEQEKTNVGVVLVSKNLWTTLVDTYRPRFSHNGK